MKIFPLVGVINPNIMPIFILCLPSLICRKLALSYLRVIITVIES